MGLLTPASYYVRMLDVIKGILSTALKDNEYLKFAVVTGCLRIAKESIFTGTNNFASYSVLDERFGSYFGFDETEVGAILEAADRKEAAEEIKEWYDGFLAGIFVGRGYSVESNKEKGLGRPDILLKDRKNRRAIIVEAKVSDKEKDLGKDCDEAIGQIKDMKYAEGLSGYEQILCYGVSFFQKQAKVKFMVTEKG